MSNKALQVLIAAGKAEHREDLRKLLEKAPYQLCEAEDGAHVLRICRDHQRGAPDCLLLYGDLTDGELPQLLEALRTSGNSRCCPIVVIIESANRYDSKTLLQLGAQDFIGQTWLNAESLVRAVDNAIEQFGLLQSLRESERVLAETQRISGVGTWHYRMDGSIEWSEQTYRVYGVSPENFSPSLDSLLGLLHPDDRQIVPDQIKAWLAGGDPGEAILRVMRPDGSFRFVSGLGKLIQDAQGNPLYLAGTVQDITDRKHKEESLQQNAKELEQIIHDRTHKLIQIVTALRISEEKFRTMVETLSDCVWEIDAEGLFTYLSPKFQDFLGYAPQEFIGRSPLDFTPVDEASRLSDTLAMYFTEKKPFTSLQSVNINRDGEYVIVEVSGAPLYWPDGQFKGFQGVTKDITRREKTLAANRELYNRLTEISKNVPGMIYQFKLRPDGTSCFPYASDAIQDIYQVAPDEVKDDASAVFTVLHPEDYDGVVASVQQSAATLQPWQHEYRVRFGDGTVRWLLGNAMPNKEDDGCVLWHGFITDITERKRLEAILQDSERKYRVQSQRLTEVIWSTDIGTWEWDIPTGQVTFNERWANIIGYTLAELEPLSLETWINHAHPEDLKHSNQLLDLYFKGESESYELEARMRHKDGHWIWILDRGRVVEWSACGKPIRMSGTHQDITQRKKAEIELIESESRFRIVADAAPVLIWIADTSKNCTWFNKVWLDFTGRNMEQEIGDGWCDGIHPEDSQKCLETYVSSFDARQAFAMDYRLRRYDGEYRWILDTGKPRFDAKGLFLGYIGSCVDITERKEFIAISEAARASAEAANRAKSAFLANMSHEIRTPMNAIIGLTHLLQQQEMLPDQGKKLQTVEASARHLLRIIDDILDLSKIEADRLLLEEIPMNMATTIRNVFSIVSESAGKNHLSILKQIDPRLDSLTLLGDPMRIGQILLNFMGNAIKFTQEGFVSLRAWIVGEEEGVVKLRIEVQDTGIGIGEDEQIRIFDAFEQAQCSTTREYGGTGLGLAISKRLAHLMGGEIGVASSIGSGSTFWFTAPLKRANDVQKMMLESNVDTVRSDAHILLVEDNEINRFVALELLECLGVKVDVAIHGAEALEKVQHNLYDLILMDIQMPVMDGIEATRLIRSTENGKTIPILALTANAFAEDRERCVQVGMNGHISKPFVAAHLYQTLARWLSSGSAGRDHPPGNSQKLSDKIGVADKVLTISLIDKELGLRNCGEIEHVYQEMQALFLTHNRDDAVKIKAAFDEGDHVTVKRIVHTLKGLASLLGATELAEAARILEGNIHDGVTGSRLLAAIDRLDQLLAQVCEEIQASQS